MRTEKKRSWQFLSFFVNKLNLWGDGAVKVGKDNCFEEPRQFTDPSGEHELNTESLFDISGTEEAIMAYFDLNSLSRELNQVGRSETDVSLRMTPVLLAEVKQARKDELTHRTYHSRDLLGSLSTKAYLTSRLKELLRSFLFFVQKFKFQIQVRRKTSLWKRLQKLTRKLLPTSLTLWDKSRRQ